MKRKIQEQYMGEQGFDELVARLLHSQIQVHIFHLQTKSFAEHKALGDYYTGIDGLVDGLIESYQGKYGLIENYRSFKNLNYESSEQIMTYFKALEKSVEELRESVGDTYIQNQIDTVVELINSTLYKLKFLS